MSDQQKQAQEPDLNQLRKVRREKLADLQANGKDPFAITSYDQTHHSQEIRDRYEELDTWVPSSSRSEERRVGKECG